MYIWQKTRSSILRIQAIVYKEILQLSRDKITFAMIVMLPFMQLILFGYAINTDVRDVRVGVVDQSQSAFSREIISSVQASQVVKFIANYPTTQEGESAIIAGKVRAVLFLPSDLNYRYSHNETLGQWLVDGSDSAISGTLSQLRNIPLTAEQAVQMREKSNFEVNLFFNPERRSATNIVPGLVPIILTMTMVLFTGIALVRERERGNIEFLITTPVRPFELMVAQIIPYVFIGLFQVCLILTVGRFIFDVPINGSILQIFFGSILFIGATLTLGLLISTIAKTQLQSMQLTVFILLPSILLSGFMFPYEGMPVVAQWISEAVPVTHFMRIIRGIVLRGAVLSDTDYDAWWLFCFMILGIIVASIRFKKRLD